MAEDKMDVAESKPAAAAPAKKDDKKKDDDELSEEDQKLKTELEMLVERLQESNASLHKAALEALRTQIRTATSSMTSVPKPLKFLRPQYATLKDVYAKWKDGENKRFLADILSILGMTYSDDGLRESLSFRFLGSAEPIGTWGHEYVRHLASEIAAEYTARNEKEESTESLIKLAKEIVPFFLKHNAEADACDLLLELESLDMLPQFVDKDTYSRICLYIVSCVQYVAPPDDVSILKTAHAIYRKVEEYPQALLISIRINDMDLIKDDFNSCPDPLLKKQLAYILARQQIFFDTGVEEITEILNNSHLSENFIGLARDLDVLEPKTPEDIYKSHLENIRPGAATANVDSARANLASTFVNAFVNAGFGSDKLISTEEGNQWIYKNKDAGMLSAAASLGVILLWDVEVGLTQIDKFLYSTDDNIKAGALLAIGLVTSGVKNDSDPAIALLSEYIESKTATLRAAAILGLGIAYAGAAREDVMELLLPLVSDTGLSMELASLASLSLGLIFVGTCHGEITSTILQTMMERDDATLKDVYAKFMGVGLALLFLGKQEAADVTLETLKAIEHPLGKLVGVIVEICAYIGTGNVLKVQSMLHLCNDHLDPEKDDDKFQAFAVIGIALIAMGEDVGAEMALRSFNHLMHYGEPVIRRAVPLALGVLCASNPAVNVLDILSKYSHDNDSEVAINAIFAMGLVGAGTNNARLAQMLRQLAAYYHKDANCLFSVRIAQGLVHMGKGTLTINPFHSNRMLLSPVAVSGLIAVLTAFTDAKALILDKAHYLLYLLVPAIYPRFLLTLDENLKSLAVTVRVGQAVDTVGQAGRPKTITGFQTHSTPVLLAYSERAEIATEEYVPLSSVLEGFVILKKNPEYMDTDKEPADHDGGDGSKSEWQKHWDAVSQNPDDFAAWETLLRLAEIAGGGIKKDSPQADVDNLRMVYDHFLAKFPLCFGYWKKYADWAMILEGPEGAEKVYERGVASIHNSVDLWTHYCTFKMENGDEESVRALFYRASEAVGYDFLSHTFWDKYIEFEESKQQSANVLDILERVIRIPMHQYPRYFEKYSQVSVTQPVASLLPADELDKIEREVRNASSDAPATKSETDFSNELRQKIHEIKSELYLANQEAVHKRWVFESEIKRPYFHIKPLDEAQLANWRRYLDFEEAEGDMARCYILYERCLVACALYEEFWLRYAKFLMKARSMDGAKNVLERASNVFLPAGRTAARLEFAELEEEEGRMDEARAIYAKILENVPGHCETLYKVAHFERRQSGVEKGDEILAGAIAEASDDKAKAFLITTRAKYFYPNGDDVERARRIYADGILSVPNEKYLALNYFLFELGLPGTPAIEYCKQAWEGVKACTAFAPEEKRELGLRLYDLLLERADIASAKLFERSLDAEYSVEVINAANAATGTTGATAAGKKRPAEDDMAHMRHEKVPKTDAMMAAPTTPVVAAPVVGGGVTPPVAPYAGYPQAMWGQMAGYYGQQP
ncbi:proteasome regulatory particle base subunit, partial [Irineochytrium annulatum]